MPSKPTEKRAAAVKTKASSAPQAAVKPLVPRTRGRQKNNERREEILQIAATLFAEKGFESTTTREIGDAAGILSGSLYHHFSTKEDMLHELLKRFLLRLVPGYNEIARSGKNVPDTLHDMIGFGLQASLDSSNILTILVHERKFLARNETFQYIDKSWQEVNKIWHGVLQRGVQENLFRNDMDLKLVLKMIMDLINATVVWYRPNSRYPLKQVIDTQVGLILHGLAQH